MNKLNINQEVLAPYLGGQIKIISSSGSYVQGGIKSIIFEDNGKEGNDKIRVNFFWKAIFSNGQDKDVRGTNLTSLSEFVINLNSYFFPDRGEEIEKSIRLYSSERQEEVILYLANSDLALNPLESIEDPSYSLGDEIKDVKQKILQKLDLAKIPEIDFSLEDLTLYENIKFIRLDLLFGNELFYFIRIAKGTQTLHYKIYLNFLDEVADQSCLTKEDIGELLYAEGGGYLWRDEFNILIQGPGRIYIEEKNRNLTRKLLQEKLCYEVD